MDVFADGMFPGHDERARRPARIGTFVAVSRGLALFIGAFPLLNVVGELRRSGFDASCWWIDLRPMAPWLSRGILSLASVLLIAFAARPRCRPWRRIVTECAVAGLLIVVALNIATFFWLTCRQTIVPGCPLPFSLLIGTALAVVLAAIPMDSLSSRNGRPAAEKTIAVLAAAMCMVCFPLAQMFCFGLTDYRRQADAAVVFGARVYSDGSVSPALADRVSTACTLYRDGLVKKVILSGGPGDGPVHETEGMRRLAIQLGVAPTDIVLDEQGVSTEATVQDTCEILATHGLGGALVVSHFYHLPRIKMAYQRCGREVYTVPAKETCVLPALPWYVARELVASWVYYLRPLRTSLP